MDLRKTALDIFSKALDEADPAHGIRNAVNIVPDGLEIAGTLYESSRYPRIIVVGAGKASARMAQALEEIVGDRIETGLINTKDGHGEALDRITVNECGHPLPDQRGVDGARGMAKLLESADERTLVISLISGGGSALLPLPANGLTLGDKQDITRLLLSSGATIGEMNAVRKHLSAVKGGGMARLAHPAALHVLILSDVIGDRLDTIASGPAVADTTTFEDCVAICRRRGIWDSMPDSARERLLDGVSGRIPETAKSGDIHLDNVRNTVIGSNAASVRKAARAAREKGFETLILTTVLEGEARELGTVFASVASEILHTGNPAAPPACIVAGGESTVTVRGDGRGGRNQEMALSAALGLDGLKRVAFLSAGTDGTDGPTDAAGGIVTEDTLNKARHKGVDALKLLDDNDSNTFLEAVDSLVITGPTGTNVMDIHILLVEEET